MSILLCFLLPIVRQITVLLPDCKANTMFISRFKMMSLPFYMFMNLSLKLHISVCGVVF
uniref:Uncharacterized protein n=1 Tax=Kalanchoe fedtschenkoi TaxID=63787 RepID=A0A7N0VHI5_KALFE